MEIRISTYMKLLDRNITGSILRSPIYRLQQAEKQQNRNHWNKKKREKYNNRKLIYDLWTDIHDCCIFIRVDILFLFFFKCFFADFDTQTAWIHICINAVISNKYAYMKYINLLADSFLPTMWKQHVIIRTKTYFSFIFCLC